MRRLHWYWVEWCYITHVKNDQQSQYMEFLICWGWKKQEIFSLKWQQPFWTQINRYGFWNPRRIMFPPIPSPHSILTLSLQISWPVATNNRIILSCGCRYFENNIRAVLWMKVLVSQLCLTLCNLMDCSLPDSSVHGIFQARILECVDIPFSRGYSWHRDQAWVPCIAGRFFTIWATSETSRDSFLLLFS